MPSLDVAIVHILKGTEDPETWTEHTIDDTWRVYEESNSIERHMHALIVKNKKYVCHCTRKFVLGMKYVEIILKVLIFK